MMFAFALENQPTIYMIKLHALELFEAIDKPDASTQKEGVLLSTKLSTYLIKIEGRIAYLKNQQALLAKANDLHIHANNEEDAHQKGLNVLNEHEVHHFYPIVELIKQAIIQQKSIVYSFTN